MLAVVQYRDTQCLLPVHVCPLLAQRFGCLVNACIKAVQTTFQASGSIGNCKPLESLGHSSLLHDYSAPFRGNTLCQASQVHSKYPRRLVPAQGHCTAEFEEPPRASSMSHCIHKNLGGYVRSQGRWVTILYLFHLGSTFELSFQAQSSGLPAAMCPRH